MTIQYTDNFRFRLPDFNARTWHQEMLDNFQLLDALIYDALQVSAITGMWEVETAYTIGTRVVEDGTSAIYTAIVNHTSGSGTFAADRLANPTYWVASTVALTPRGAWAKNTVYNANDLAYQTSEGVAAICLTSHTSSNGGADTIRTDAVKWAFFVDVQAILDATDIGYDNSVSLLVASDMQAAIDELVVSLALKAPKASPTLTGTPTGPTPSTSDNSTKLATTAYVVAKLAQSGLLVNYDVRVATTGAITIATGLNNGDTIDGVVLATNDRVLVKDQAAPAQNGVWIVGAVPARATDADSWDEHIGMVVNVAEGTANAGNAYRCTANAGGTLDTTALNFSSFGTSISLPIAIADGGTGQGTAADAFTALKQAATTAATGVVERATVAECRAGAGAVVPMLDDLYDAADPVALADGATVTLDFATGINFTLAIGGNRTLAASNYATLIGKSGWIRITQDATGSRTLNSAAAPFVNAGQTDIVLSTAANTVDVLSYRIIDIGAAAKIILTIEKNVG